MPVNRKYDESDFTKVQFTRGIIMIDKKEPSVSVKGEKFSLSYTETGRFEVTKAELQNIIIMVLSQTRSGSRPIRALFRLMLKHMKIRTRGKPAEELLKIFLENLRELKDLGKIEFTSGKAKPYVRLNKS